MIAEEHFDSHDDDEQPSIVSCKRCGKEGLHWENDGGTYQLYESAYKLHKCNLPKALLNDFEEIA